MYVMLNACEWVGELEARSKEASLHTPEGRELAGGAGLGGAPSAELGGRLNGNLTRSGGQARARGGVGAVAVGQWGGVLEVGREPGRVTRSER